MARSLAMFFACCAAFAMPVTLVAGCSDDSGDEHAGHNDDHDHDDSGDAPHDHSQPVGPPSGAKCPSNSTLTYGNFGEAFFKDYCLRCHSEKVKGTARMNAPADHNFDTLEEIELLSMHIDQMAAAGDSHTNETMPPSNPKPSLDARKKLGEWIACGVPE